MTSGSNKMIGDFSKKPQTEAFYADITAYVKKLGSSQKTVKAQVSFAVHRKFLWMWTYEKTPDGTLYLTVCLDKKLEDPHFHYIAQVSKNRWNHHVEVKSAETANSDWLHRLISTGYEFAQK